MKTLTSTFILLVSLVAFSCFDIVDASLPNDKMSDAEKLAVCEKKMNIRFPKDTQTKYLKAEGGLDSNIELIIEFDDSGWDEFRKNPIFQTEELKIFDAENQNGADWNFFKTNEAAAQSYQIKNSYLNVLARKTADANSVFVYLFWHEI